MNTILLVEDDPILGKSLTAFLSIKGYRVNWAQALHDAYEINKNEKADLVVLDVNLPDGSGLELCSSLRGSGSQVPIIFLTAKVDEASVVAGFNAGGTDYVRKPFGNLELLARINSALKANQFRNEESVLRYGDLAIHLDKRRVFIGEHELELQRREFDILKILVERSEGVVTRENLLAALARATDSKAGEIVDRSIDSHLSHIRAKLRKAGVANFRINSVYGIGYRLEKR